MTVRSLLVPVEKTGTIVVYAVGGSIIESFAKKILFARDQCDRLGLEKVPSHQHKQPRGFEFQLEGKNIIYDRVVVDSFGLQIVNHL